MTGEVVTEREMAFVRRLRDLLDGDIGDPANPKDQIIALARRVDALTREKEDLEDFKRDAEKRLERIEHLFDKGVFNVEGPTLKWLARADEDKLKEIDAAVQFMRNAQFMGRWTWVGLSVIGAAVAAIVSVYGWLKGIKL